MKNIVSLYLFFFFFFTFFSNTMYSYLLVILILFIFLFDQTNFFFNIFKNYLNDSFDLENNFFFINYYYMSILITYKKLSLFKHSYLLSILNKISNLLDIFFETINYLNIINTRYLIYKTYCLKLIMLNINFKFENKITTTNKNEHTFNINYNTNSTSKYNNWLQLNTKRFYTKYNKHLIYKSNNLLKMNNNNTLKLNNHKYNNNLIYKSNYLIKMNNRRNYIKYNNTLYKFSNTRMYSSRDRSPIEQIKYELYFELFHDIKLLSKEEYIEKWNTYTKNTYEYEFGELLYYDFIALNRMYNIYISRLKQYNEIKNIDSDKIFVERLKDDEIKLMIYGIFEKPESYYLKLSKLNNYESMDEFWGDFYDAVQNSSNYWYLKKKVHRYNANDELHIEKDIFIKYCKGELTLQDFTNPPKWMSMLVTEDDPEYKYRMEINKNEGCVLPQYEYGDRFANCCARIGDRYIVYFAVNDNKENDEINDSNDDTIAGVKDDKGDYT